jgi:Flp pilus assembly protein TadD
MRAAAERAMQLDRLLPEANGALGMVLARDGKWAESEKSFRRAIALNPHRSESYGDFSVYVLMQEERIGEALEQMRLAQKSDPLPPEVRSELAYVLMSAHLYDEAAAQCEKLPKIAIAGPRRMKASGMNAWAALASGKADSAKRLRFSPTELRTLPSVRRCAAISR